MRDSVIERVEQAKGTKAVRRSRESLVKVNSSILNIRTACDKGEGYWFDVTPSFFASVQFFLFACGTSSLVYVFPANVLEKLTARASLGGQKQVPNFTIYPKDQRFDPAGCVSERANISAYLNNYSLIP